MPAEQEEEPDNLGFDPAREFGAEGQLLEIRGRMYTLGLADSMRNRLGAIVEAVNQSEQSSAMIGLALSDLALLVRALETYTDALAGTKPVRMFAFSPDTRQEKGKG